MLTLDSVDRAERFVNKQQTLDNDVRWDNYDIVFFRPAPQGAFRKQGAFRNGQWGFENRFAVSEKGEWNIDWRNVRRAKGTRD